VEKQQLNRNIGRDSESSDAGQPEPLSELIGGIISVARTRASKTLLEMAEIVSE
jgi:hypothetical protein